MQTKTTRSSEAETAQPRLPTMCGDRLLVRQDKAEEGEIALLDKTKESMRPLRGAVLAISPAIAANNPPAGRSGGPGRVQLRRNEDKTPIHVGDRVYFAPYATETKLNLSGEELEVLTIDDILAVEQQE